MLYLLLGFALTALGCYSAGALLLSKTGGRWTWQEALGIRFVAGAALYSTAIFYLGIGHLYYRATFVAIPLALTVTAWLNKAWALPAESLPPLPKHWTRLLWAVAGPFTVLYLVNAMAPEASPDGTTYHLGLVAKYFRLHAMVPVTTVLYAALTQGMEMLFLSAFAVGRHSAAAMVHLLFLVTLPWLMLSYGRRHNLALAGLAAALFVYCSPVVGIDGISAYNDAGAACLLFALLTVLRRMEDEPAVPGLWLLAGLLAGFAFAIKYTLFPALLLTGVWILFTHRRNWWRPACISAAAALSIMLPWLIRNAVWWQNPLAPFFNRWFPNPYVQLSFELDYYKHMAHYGLQSLWQIPLEVTVRGGELGGMLGPIFLLAPLGLLALRHPEGRRLLLAGLLFSATYFSNVGTRFLIPPLPFLAFAMAMALTRWNWLPMALVLLHAGLSWPGAMTLYCSQYAWRLDEFPWRYALRLSSEQEFLARRVAAYPITRKLEELVPPNSRILGFNQIPEAYTNREYLVSFQSFEGSTMRDITMMPLAKERQPTMLSILKIAPTKLHALRVVQTIDNSDQYWSVAEMRVYSAGKEIPRGPQWRLRANVSPHEVQAAFDNSFVTRWLTDRPRFNGMYLEVDFDREETVDKVHMVISPDQEWDKFRLEARDAQGHWRPLPTQLDLRYLTTPLGMRRAVVDELLRRNIQYLLMNPEDFIATDVTSNPEIWGLAKVADIGGIQLHRLLPQAEFEAGLKKAGQK